MSENKERKTLEERNQASDLERLRHSCAHVCATAICRLWPEAQLAAGPAVENGFYYDIELDHNISSDEFALIEEEMKKVVKENQPFVRTTVTRAEAMDMAQRGELGSIGPRSVPSKYKVDLLNRIPDDEEISIYRNGDFTDLCAGPHVGRTGNCKAFKIMSVASAYYQGDAGGPRLQRVYGTCFPNRTQLDEHLAKLEEARKRDHRKLGREMGLFTIDEMVGQGLVLWKPKGAIIRRELQDFITEELDRIGYSQVYTPNIGKLDLYMTSGHWEHYKESQFPPIPDPDDFRKLRDENASCADLFNALDTKTICGFMLKPMNCPHHIRIYASDPHSYRDLPVRLAEFGTVYRWEQSGELGGMTRVRGFTQDDAHIFCRPDQIKQEVQQCIGIVKHILGTLQMNDYRVRLSLRDKEFKDPKYVGSLENWQLSEQALREVLQENGFDYIEAENEAAFYGPKIDFIVRDVIGRDWQLGTVQVDYNLPERFELTYTGADNKPHRPVMIHRAPFGSMERFTGLLIEHFAGKFPTWLAPEQVRVLPISDKVADFAKQVYDKLASLGIRVKLDADPDKIGAKIRNARLDRVPYMLVVGQREADEGQVSVRHRDLDVIGTMPVDTFVAQLKREIDERLIAPEMKPQGGAAS
ncbi:MAG TPA: threonine--tRNA ligase [Candidatus Akkermansia intestinigallinarum]|uniref:Threonine--tRNA ligase n=1 Tax=Candidatus Akkermansia intestinigallinarum TaxID=2838431 RepID=A0A9D2AIP5_9BACT|nr:threonine--tRNA ligase [Candidatus Akkermansia intestinigallinarum]